MSSIHERCPKCGHQPLPADQSFPATCPACGVILSRVPLPGPVPAPARSSPAMSRPRLPRRGPASFEQGAEVGDRDEDGLAARLLEVPDRVDPLAWNGRAALWLALAVWGAVLVGLDLEEGEMMSSFLHRPLLVFHEAGHVIFRVFGEWMGVFGGTLGQLVMPAVLAGALLWRNRDPFGAAVGLWFLGVSLLDVAPYVYDSFNPQLTLLGGGTGADSFHDWIWLLGGPGTPGVRHAHAYGRLWHAAGTGTILVALGWAAWLLRRQWARRDASVLRER